MSGSDGLAGSTIAGCRIIKKIGQGGMGAVYTADHLSLGKVVCVKILSPELARETRNIEFFMREARSAAKLEHPNIVRVYSFGQEQGFHYIVMSYIEGVSLADVIAKDGPLEPDAAADIMMEVFDALKHAHSKAIIHRDIKPSNILLGSDGHPIIVDFGLARSISEEKLLTMAGEMIGTAYFMSPEQGLAGQVDHRADLYSAGATFFYLLTGKYPFEGKTYIEVVHKHIGEALPSIMVLRPEMPLWVSRVLDLLMRKNPKDRYQSADQVMGDIKKLRAAEKDGASANIEIPGLSERLAAAEAAPAPLEAPVQKAAPAPAPAPAAEEKTGLFARSPDLGGAGKVLAYCAVTFSSIACFLLSGAAAAPEPGVLRSMRAALSSAPAEAGSLLIAGTALLALSVFFRPATASAARLSMLALSAVSAYACAAYLPYEGTQAAAAKAFSALGSAAAYAMSHHHFPVYSLCLYVAASNLSLRRHWAAKTASLAAFLASLALTCAYLGGTPLPRNNYMMLAAGASLAGTAAALTHRRSVLFSAPILFLAANALALAMFTSPHVDAFVGKQIEMEERRRASSMDMAYERAGFGQEERDAVAQATGDAPASMSQAERRAHARAATAAYYKMMAAKIERNTLKTAGLLILSVFLLVMANLLFMENAVSGRWNEPQSGD